MTRLLALSGDSGVGKTTLAGYIAADLAAEGLVVRRFRIAEPLYKLQARVHRLAGRRIDTTVQDGELLSFLGKHLRRLNPRSLTDDLERRIERTTTELDVDVVICEDARPIDVPTLTAHSFTVIEVRSNRTNVARRRVERGDISLAEEGELHAVNVSDLVGHIIDNDDGLADLHEAGRRVLEALGLVRP